MKQKIKIIVLSLLITLFVISAVMICTELVSRQREKNNFDTLAELVENTEPTDTQPTDTTDTQSAETEPQVKPKDLSVLFEQNGECVGWLTVPDSNINYPVMHTPKEPEKYLRRDFYNKYSQSGVPFIDSRCSLTDSNLIIYGHNMKNGTMFSDLKKFRDSQFRKEHEIIYLQTADGSHKFRVTEVISTNIKDEKYNDITLNGERKLLLSTCYGNSKSDRLLVIATETE